MWEVKRYLVFAGSFYYPNGGGNDFVFATDDLDEARDKRNKYKKEAFDWSHIFDNETLEII